ncbi:DNA-binding transcriptional LysR family regulator [Prauserella shujinwangii]|uniref:DNA-binding transcriptional LysR family regulator n=1 Tax=Prauserella shujinwangii TaxID=1453103 RepID=A0A2T0M0J4_9PSEU|nr:LysR family transcriptional regulator [Prauserella shujinwangii]PRX50115.1 DNA-binding transcriptional LysR family regulator [Prauserella shujinwangii]
MNGKRMRAGHRFCAHPGSTETGRRLELKQTGGDDIGIRQLRYFLAVVRAKTVSGAAQSLRISQPSLSQQILRLERTVGTTLFRRTSRGVELTSGGHAFLRGVEEIPEQLRSAIEAAVPRTAAWPVGVCSGTPASLIAGIDSEIVADWSEMCAGEEMPSLQFVPAHSREQPDLLRHGEIAMGLMRLPVTTTRLFLAVVADERLGVVLHESHPLCDRDVLAWADLRGQRLLWFDTEHAPGYAESVLRELDAVGWRPSLNVIDNRRHSLFIHSLRSARDLVALRPRSAVQGDRHLVWKEIADDAVPREQLALAAREGTDHAERLLRMARRNGWPIVE